MLTLEDLKLPRCDTQVADGALAGPPYRARAGATSPVPESTAANVLAWQAGIFYAH